MYPTTIRGTALCFFSLSGTIASGLAPFIIDGSLKGGVEPMIALGVAGGVGCLLVIPLPETKGKRMPSNISELQTAEE